MHEGLQLLSLKNVCRLTKYPYWDVRGHQFLDEDIDGMRASRWVKADLVEPPVSRG